MTRPDIESQAEIVRAILPTADIRTDQCDILRVCCEKLFGAVKPLPDERFEWSITDLDAPGDLPCVAAGPIVREVAKSSSDAARNLADAMKRMIEG